MKRLLPIILLSLWAHGAIAQKISQLPPAASISGTELIPAVQSANTVSITPAQIRAFIATSANSFIGPQIFNGTTGNTVSISGGSQTNSAALAIYPTNGNTGLFLSANSTAGQSFGMFVRAGTNGSDYAASVANAANTQNLFEVLGSGAIDLPAIAAGGGVTGYVCWNSATGGLTYDTSAGCPTSSERFKTDIRSLDWALADVEKLRPVTYHTKAEDDPQYHGAREQLGFIAEEVVKVNPDLVQFDRNGKLPRTVIYDRVTVLLVKAMQEEHRHVLELAATQAVTLLWVMWLTWRISRRRRRP